MRDAEMQIERAIHGGGASRGVASVEEYVLGGGHEFMHEHEHEIACLPSWALPQWRSLL